MNGLLNSYNYWIMYMCDNEVHLSLLQTLVADRRELYIIKTTS